ncbi:MAG: 3-methyl-2-oxobutanoate hydroxymethyltransferase [Abditibacteriota bacterium]|nr:3-methyl-2-oxobutanoate hydroxymethyltransferase [Abditibacteriota bacterium]
MKRNTIRTIKKLKEDGEKITVLTGYDYMWGNCLDNAGVDIILVGDSLGNTVLGYDTTCPVTMEDMIRHSAAVVRGSEKALILIDMPFMSYVTSEDAVKNAGRLIAETGGQAVKLEGGLEFAPMVRKIVENGIPVCAHIGLRPQSVNIQGYNTQGIDYIDKIKLKEDALALQDAGAFMIVLEKMDFDLAAEITDMLDIPTIGIGSGQRCDGQVLVIHDILGLFDKFVPPFVKQYANLRGEIIKAAKAYIDDVKGNVYPEK